MGLAKLYSSSKSIRVGAALEAVAPFTAGAKGEEASALLLPLLLLVGRCGEEEKRQVVESCLKIGFESGSASAWRERQGERFA